MTNPERAMFSVELPSDQIAEVWALAQESGIPVSGTSSRTRTK